MTSIRTFLAVIMLSFLASADSRCADGERQKHPIDIALDKAMDKDPSTAGMVRAISDANAAWDKEMNIAYRALKKEMKPDEWTALVEAQKAWIAFRDAQTKALHAFYSHMEGTMWISVSASVEMNLTKDRALFLGALKEQISER